MPWLKISLRISLSKTGLAPSSSNRSSAWRARTAGRETGRRKTRPTACRPRVSRSTTSLPSLPTSGGCSSRPASVAKHEPQREMHADDGNDHGHHESQTALASAAKAAFQQHDATAPAAGSPGRTRPATPIVRLKIAAGRQADHAERDHRQDQRQVRRQHFVERHAAQRQAEHHDRQRGKDQDAASGTARPAACPARSPRAAADWPAAFRSSCVPSRR